MNFYIVTFWNGREIWAVAVEAESARRASRILMLAELDATCIKAAVLPANLLKPTKGITRLADYIPFAKQ